MKDMSSMTVLLARPACARTLTGCLGGGWISIPMVALMILTYRVRITSLIPRHNLVHNRVISTLPVSLVQSRPIEDVVAGSFVSIPGDGHNDQMATTREPYRRIHCMSDLLHSTSQTPTLVSIANVRICNVRYWTVRMPSRGPMVRIRMRWRHQGSNHPSYTCQQAVRLIKWQGGA